MGATNPADAAEGTIRKSFAKSIGENSVHGSDAPETAAEEIAYWFSQPRSSAEPDGRASGAQPADGSFLRRYRLAEWPRCFVQGRRVVIEATPSRPVALTRYMAMSAFLNMSPAGFLGAVEDDDADAGRGVVAHVSDIVGLAQGGAAIGEPSGSPTARLPPRSLPHPSTSTTNSSPPMRATTLRARPRMSERRRQSSGKRRRHRGRACR
jgi:hypothetical protein